MPEASRERPSENGEVCRRMTDLYWDDEDDGQEGLLTRRSSEHCLSEREIEDFLFNRLSGVTREAVEEHLLFCQRCLAKVEEEERLMEAARAAAGKLETEVLLGEPPGGGKEGKARRSRRLPPWLTMAAAVSLLAASGTVTYRLLYPPDVFEVELRVERSGVDKSRVPAAGKRLLLIPDLRGLPPLPQFHWSIVDSLGAPVAEGTLDVRGTTGRIEVGRGLPAGMYWVRLLDPHSGALMREFGLVVQSKGR
ncbi:MAG: hypothetical protein ACP5VC_11315 [Bryobacteraceae bacterium]